MKLELLKRTRLYKGFLQKDIAQNLGISQKSYNLKENGKREFNRNEMIAIVESLDLTMNEVNEIFFNNTISRG